MAAGRQEDAHEYLSNLIHAAVDAGARAHGHEAMRVDDKGTSDLCEHREQYLHALFKGSICSQIRCGQCGSVSSMAEAVQGLELEVAHAGTLQGALEGYCRTEELGRDTDNAYDCSVCQAHTAAQKSLSIVTAPQILRIQVFELVTPVHVRLTYCSRTHIRSLI
jgi:ubiquitin carboxyl-terminal hydrolase 36/42